MIPEGHVIVLNYGSSLNRGARSYPPLATMQLGCSVPACSADEADVPPPIGQGTFQSKNEEI